MENKQDVKLEMKLIKLGFKRKWLDDKSGYWMEYSFKGALGLKYSIDVETDRKRLEISLAQPKKHHFWEFIDIKRKYSEANILKAYKELKQFK